VIDGWHRIHRALDLGLEELPAILLDPADERTCRLHGGGI
jgi:ParB-like chromosome segregation protein Spo0J